MFLEIERRKVVYKGSRGEDVGGQKPQQLFFLSFFKAKKTCSNKALNSSVPRT